MPNYTTADDPLAYDEQGNYPGKHQPWYVRAAEGATFGIYDPNYKEATNRNKQIIQAQTEQNLNRAKADEWRNEAAKNIQAFAQNLVQFTGIDKAEALKLATEHYQEQSALQAQQAQNAVTKGKAEGALPFAKNVGAEGAQDDIVAKQANRSRNTGALQQSEASNTLGTPKTNALTDSTEAKKKLAQEQGGLATAIDQNSTAELERALKDPAAEQKYLRDQQLIKQLQAAGGVAGAKMRNQQTTADAAALAGDIQSGEYDKLRQAGQALPFQQHIGPGAAVVNSLTGQKTEQPALPVGMYQRGLDANGEPMYGVYRGVMAPSTADKVAQPIQSPVEPGVVRIPRRSLLNPNQQ